MIVLDDETRLRELLAPLNDVEPVTRRASLRDRELLELLAGEAVGASTGLRRRRRVRAMVATVAAAVAAALAIMFWPASTSPSVLDSALAAIGTGQVTHVVFEDDLGSTLLDLRTGRQTPASGRLSVWYAPARGLLIRSSFLGVDEGSTFITTKMQTLGGRPAPSAADFVRGYRAALRAHRFHLVGSGSYRGTSVFWIDSTPSLFGRAPTHRIVERVAISKVSYKPVFVQRLVDGKPAQGSGQHILSIQTSDTGPGALDGTRTRSAPFGSNIGYFNGVVQYEPLTLTEARAMRPTPLIPKTISGLRLSVIARAPYTTTPNSSQNIPGVLLYYGTPYNSGLPNDTQPAYTGRWAQIIEFPHTNLVTRFFAGHFPTGGKAVIDGFAGSAPALFGTPGSAGQFGDTTGDHTATLTTQGRYFLIDATTRGDAIQAARALR